MSHQPFAGSMLGTWVRWTLGFLAFPLAGIAGRAVAGPIDSATAALLGGLITGVVIGTGQWLASGRRLGWSRWIPATAIGMAAGLLTGAVVVDFGTGLNELAVMGAITGTFLGLAQALVLPGAARRRWVWALAMPVLWSLGWTVTTLAGIDVVSQYTVFGASGAITVSALSGLVFLFVLPQTARTTVGSVA